jgi:methionine-rich copper-binding protein CopC
MNLSKIKVVSKKIKKMKRTFFFLSFSLSIVIVKSLLSHQKNVIVNNQKVQKESLAAKYSFSFAPSDITVTFNKDQKDVFHGRAISKTTIKNQTLPAEKKKQLTSLIATSTDNTLRKTRTNDSLSRKYSGN